MNRISEIIHASLDHSPREIYNFARSKILKTTPIDNFDDQHPCVFVLSTGRVGTETLAYLFGLLKNIFSYHEPSPPLFSLSKLAYEMSDLYRTDKNIRDVFQTALLASRKEIINYSLSCRRGFIETGPDCTFLSQVILDTIPNVKFVHLVRDHYDVVRSGMRRRWYDGHKFDPSRITPLKGSKFFKSWKDYTPLEKNLWLWAETNQRILDFTKGLPSPDHLLIHSKAMFQNEKSTIDSLFRFIGNTQPSERRIASILNKKLNMQRSGELDLPDDYLITVDKELGTFVQSVSGSLNAELT
jgi:hypothetical protein